MYVARGMPYIFVLSVVLIAAPATTRDVMAQARAQRAADTFTARLAEEQEIAIAFNREVGAFHVKVFSPEERQRHLDLAARVVKREELLRKMLREGISEQEKDQLRKERDAIKISAPVIYHLYRITRSEQDYLELRPVPPSLQKRMILPTSRISAVELPEEKTAEAPVE